MEGILRQPSRTFGPFLNKLVSTSLRLPGIVILELWCRIFWDNSDESNAIQERLHDKVRTWMELFELPQLIKSRNLDVVMDHVLTYSVLAFGLTFLFLSTAKLVTVYLHVVSVFLMGAGYYLSFRYVETEQETGGEIIMDDFGKLERHGFHFLSQVMLAVVVSCLLSLRSDAMRASLTVFSLPIVARLCGFPVEKLHVVHNFSCCFTMMLLCFYALNIVPDVMAMLRRAENTISTSLRNDGLAGTIIYLWKKLDLPTLFALFWLVLCSTEIYVLYKGGNNRLNFVEKHPDEHVALEMELRSYIRSSSCMHCLLVFANCCKTPLSLMAFCAAVAYFSWTTLFFTKAWLKSDGDENDFPRMDVFNSGHAEAFTLMLLAVQTDLIDQPALTRALLILIILFIVMSSLLQSIFDVVEPVVLRISAARLNDISRHAKALSLCFVLVALPVFMSVSIAKLLPVDFWLLIIISSCVLTSVQTLGAVAIYLLFAYDGWRNGPPWDRLDDYVFVCRAATRVLEFLVAVFVIAYGVYESVFGEWSWMNSSILLIHCYFNVWQRLQAGWKSFLLRRDAAKKLDVLPKASKIQLDALQDVCAICYQEMKEARVTPCNHFFHGGCLKKWLYVQQSCPMCHWDLSFKSMQTNAHTGQEHNGDDEEGYSSDEYELAHGDAPE